MRGRTVLAETIAGAGEVAKLGEELAALEHKMADGRRSRAHGGALRRGAGALPGARRLRRRGARAHHPGRPGPLARAGRRRRRQALRRLEDARGAGADPPARARRAAPRRADQLPRHRVDPLARGLPARLSRRGGHDLPRPRRHEPRRREDRRDRRRRRCAATPATTTSTSRRARSTPSSARRPTSGSRRCWPRRCASSSASARRRPRRRRCRSRIKKLDKIERIEPPRRIVEKQFDFRRPPRSGDDVVKVAGVCKAYGDAQGARRPRPARPPRRALGGHGRERRRQVDAAQDDGGRATARSRRGDRRRVGDDGLLRAAPDGAARRRAHRLRGAAGARADDRHRRAAQPGRRLRLPRRRRRQAGARALRRREGPPGAGQDPVRRAEPPRPRRADQPPRHRRPSARS